MLLKTKLIAGAIVGLATTIGVLMTPFNAKQLPAVIAENQQATKNATQKMQTATTVIKSLEGQINTDNETITALENALSDGKHSSNVKNMTDEQQMAILKSLLESWGYTQGEITFITGAFSKLNSLHSWRWAAINSNKANNIAVASKNK